MARGYQRRQARDCQQSGLSGCSSCRMGGDGSCDAVCAAERGSSGDPKGPARWTQMFEVQQAAERPTRHREVLQLDLPLASAALKG